MPLFFFLSGFLWSNKGIKHNFKRLIIPYFILCGINFGIVAIFSILQKETVVIGKYLIGIVYSRGTTEWLPNCSPLWYLTASFCASLVFGLIEKFICNEKIRLCVVVFCMAISFILDLVDFPKLFWNIDTALMGVSFMYAGALEKKYAVIDRINIYWCLILLTVAVVCVSLNSFVSFDGNAYGNPLLMLFGAIGIIIALAVAVKRVLKRFERIGSLLSYFGRHTVFIMGFDYLAADLCTIGLRIVGYENWAILFSLKVCILFLGIFIWTKLIGVIKNERVRKILAF